jgi:hypothetical protein
MKLNKKALTWAIVMMALSYTSNLLFPGPVGPDSSVFYFLGVALLGVITYQVVKRYFPGKPKTIGPDVNSPKPQKPDSQISFSRKGLYLIAGLLIISLLINIRLYYKAKEIPWVSAGIQEVQWLGNDQVKFSGIPQFSDPADDWKTGYQLWTGEVRVEYLGDKKLKCRVNQAMVLDGIITIDGPFKTEDRTCKILAFDGEKQSAVIEAQGITFSVLGKKVTWQDKSDGGALIELYDFMRRRH